MWVGGFETKIKIIGLLIVDKIFDNELLLNTNILEIRLLGDIWNKYNIYLWY
jgi:hypothetical protein